ncbi:anion permease [Halobacteriales archaeon SW_7_68_16]|nr:MAG: anion permease [Halobacteriales archaeon SW_7_68_16]
MVDVSTVATLVVATATSFFMAWAIGAGSSGSTPFAPAVGANAISVMRAGFVVGLLGFLGAVLQGANVTEAVGRELIRDVTLSPTAATVGLLTAGILVVIGVFAGYPIATAFTVTGAVVGVGLGLGGQPAWAKYREIATLWVLVPFVGGGAAYGTARVLQSDRTPVVAAVPALAALVAAVVANVEFALLGPAGEGGSIAGTGGAALPGLTGGALTGRLVVTLAAMLVVGVLSYRDTERDPAVGQRRLLLALGGLVAFSAGGSQVGLALGPLLPLLDRVPLSIPLSLVLAGGGLGLLVGSWTGAPRMIKALSQDYSSLSPRRSIAALIPAFLIAQTAVLFGVPVSFNEVVVSAIVGSGYAAGTGGVSREKIVYTVLAWIGSLVLAIAISYVGFVAIDAVA